MSDDRGYYAHQTYNSPLSAARALELVARLTRVAPATVLDLGCGWGELLLQVIAAGTGRGVGVDTDEALIARARAAAVDRGLADRVRFDVERAAEATGPADLVLCVGSGHAVGADLAATLTALFDRVHPGGRVLFGEGFWEPVGPVEEALVYDDVLALPDLPTLLDATVAAGFRPLWIETASRSEWEAFESGYLADDEEWLLRHPEHPEAPAVREEAAEHRRRWLRGYRHGLGFAYLTLGRPV